MKRTGNWFVLFYKLPPEANTGRVYIWRQVKKLGALYMQDGGVILPQARQNLLGLKKICNKIEESGGKATLLLSSFLDSEKEKEIIKDFNNTRDLEYKELLEQCGKFFLEIKKETEKENYTSEELEEIEEELEKLEKWFQKIKQRDFFKAPMCEKAEETLKECKKRLGSFADITYQRLLSQGEHIDANINDFKK